MTLSILINVLLIKPYYFQVMECLVKIELLLLLLLRTTIYTAVAQHSRSHSEVFFVNLEEGYFGCQVNASAEFLQIFKVSKLCDGTSDCYLGSDEDTKELKCSSKYSFSFIKWRAHLSG